MKSEDLPRYLSVKQSAEYLNVSTWLIRQIIHKHEIPYVRRGKAFVLDKADLDRWFEKAKTTKK